uniref:Amino_oxidase domain-containing protein n=1 Tax=Macrostomum lignano TaxID=282301 RepID=A0A1I8FNH0_9PLAT
SRRTAAGPTNEGGHRQLRACALKRVTLLEASFRATLGHGNVDCINKRWKATPAFETAQHVYGQTRADPPGGRAASAIRLVEPFYVGDAAMLSTMNCWNGSAEVARWTVRVLASSGLVNDDEEKLKSPDSTWDTDLASTATTWQCEHRVRVGQRPTAKLNVTSVFRGKYPESGQNFESGAATLLRVKHQGERWPAALVDRPLVGLLDALVRRINEGSGTYQMLSFLGDIVLLNRDRTAFTLLEEVPVRLLNSLRRSRPSRDGPVLRLSCLNTDATFSGLRADTLKGQRRRQIRPA